MCNPLYKKHPSGRIRQIFDPVTVVDYYLFFVFDYYHFVLHVLLKDFHVVVAVSLGRCGVMTMLSKCLMN